MNVETNENENEHLQDLSDGHEYQHPELAEPPADEQSDAPEGAADEPSEYVFAGKKFKSQQEAEDYHASVERNYVSQKAIPPVVPAPQEELEELIDGVPVSDLILTDPGKFAKYTRQKAKDEAYAAFVEMDTKRKNEANYWKDFYASNKDLVGADEIVKAHMNQNWDKYKSMDADKAKDLIAKESRKVLNSIMKSRGVKVEELSSSRTASLGSSKSGSSTTKKAPQAPMSFVEAIKKQKALRRA